MESALASPVAEQEDEDERQLDVTLAGEHYTVAAGRQQLLNLLASTFENAEEKNKELARTNEELTVAQEQLTSTNQALEAMHDQLEAANQRMSRDLDAAARVQQSLLPSAVPEIRHAADAGHHGVGSVTIA